MIERKKKICKECGREDYIFSKGRCKACASKTYKKAKPMTAAKKKEKKERAEKLNGFFYYHINLCTKSEESGIPIKNPNKVNIAHIFPKRNYKSVEDHPLNAVYLTINEHTMFDTFMDRMDFPSLEVNFPNAWPKVVSRVREFLPDVKENKILKIKFEKYLDINNE